LEAAVSALPGEAAKASLSARGRPRADILRRDAYIKRAAFMLRMLTPDLSGDGSPNKTATAMAAQ
jgi:hypothetical protein